MSALKYFFGNLKKVVDTYIGMQYYAFQREVPVLHILVCESGTSHFLYLKQEKFFRGDIKANENTECTIYEYEPTAEAAVISVR